MPADEMRGTGAPMTRTPTGRRPLVRRAAAALALTLSPGLLMLGPVAHAEPSDTLDPGPINAGNTYGWYPVTWKYDWERGQSQAPWPTQSTGTGVSHISWWALNVDSSHPKVQGSYSNPSTGSVSALQPRKGKRYGRWEARVKTSSWPKAGGAQYRAVAELVPQGGDRHCGAQTIGLGAFTPELTGDKWSSVRPTFDLYARAQGKQYTFQKSATWSSTHTGYHTLGVELTRKKVTWFVDAKAVAQAPIQTGGVPYQFRFALEAPNNTTPMMRTRYQVDWVRYFKLHKPAKRFKKINRRADRVPVAQQSPYAGC